MNNDIKKMLADKAQVATMANHMDVSALFKYLEILDKPESWENVEVITARIARVCDAIEKKLGL